MRNLVVNLHLLEQCNYRCRHCFSQFGSPGLLDLSFWEKIVDNILRCYPDCRINLAGGEPLLLSWIWDLVNHIRQKGAEVSLITNGSLLKADLLQPNTLSMIGISIDSFSENTLVKMGRCTESGMALSGGQYRRLCGLVKSSGSDLKINTVVTRLNLWDDFSPIQEIAPKRWKILRMQTFKTEDFDNSHLAVSDQEYETFCQKQESLGITFVRENSMRNSYIFVDPAGDLIDNAEGRYDSVGNLLQEDFDLCLGRLPLDKELYERRYADNSVPQNTDTLKGVDSRRIA